MYSTLTDSQKALVLRAYRESRPFATDTGHAVAIAASRLVSPRRWNSKAGADAFAAALATLVMAKEITIA